MCTVTLSYDSNNAVARQKLEVLLSTGLFMQVHSPSAEHASGNRVFISDGEVKTETVTDAMDLEEMRCLLHEMVDLEYSLP
jgi:cephalosporin-C deacetylase-like acetyl esterase